MKSSKFNILISLFVLPCFFFAPSQTSQTHHHCLDEERSTLLRLEQHLYYAPNSTFSSKAELWDTNNNNNSDCCSWKGVTCNGDGRVIGVDLNYSNLSGSFHPIFSLRHLQRLNLAGNNFNSTLLEYEFDRLSNLTHLNLSDSCFFGQIPVGISYLTRLVSLDLSYQDDCYWRNHNPMVDYYVVKVPTLELEKPNLKRLVQNLRSLTELYLDGVNISSQSNNNWCETISLAVPKLRVLSMADSGLTGPLCSSLSGLPSLSTLNLDFNPMISNYLPPNFLEFSSHLVSLNLRYCNLSGHFPTQVFLLPKIQSIRISFNFHLSGQLPEFPSNSTLQVLLLVRTNFSGKLPETIGNLKFLTTLSLGSCNFSGQIPSSIGNLSNLVNLDLRMNKLYGSIPKSIFGLPRLESLYIDKNSFDSMNLELFFQLKDLRNLGLSNISLSIGSYDNSLTTFPQLDELFLRSCNLTEFPEFIKTQDKLTWLDLSNNHIQGFVPNWLWKPTLLNLDLSSNAIDIPKQLRFGFADDANSSFPMLDWLNLGSCNLSRFPELLKSQQLLRWLDLSNNNISGAVPNWMWKKSLERMDLSNNKLSSLDQSLVPNHSLASSQASFMSPICNLGQLSYFNASYNNLSGPIPNCLSNITTLTILDLQSNHFSGMLPSFSKTVELGILRVGENRLEGKLPTSLAKCTYLEVLDVGNNMISDTFPIWLGKLPALTILVLRKNRFYGEVKHFKHKSTVFPALDVLDIASNQFCGELSLDFLQATQISSLKINNNKLVGKLPRSLANCTKLEVLDLGNNTLRDTFPWWLEKLPSLQVLILRANGFYGEIRTCEGANGFPMLRILDIASNNFSGDLSSQFFHCLSGMTLGNDGSNAKLDYIGERNYYQDSVTIVNKGLEMVFNKILTTLACLDVSNNNFDGTIPEEIRYLQSLIVLNFSNNNLVGPIPSALENLTELESLDLSHNKLSRRIPSQLTSLTFLSTLNLSYNRLEGMIPQSYQFNTFTNDSYRGNPRLCGLPLTGRCRDELVDEVPTPPAGKHEDSWGDGMTVWKMALIGYGGGLVVGLCIGYTVLNEKGDKWVHSLKMRKNGKNNRRRGRRSS